MTSPLRESVFAFIRETIVSTGMSPTLTEIAAEFGFSSVAAWKHVQRLIAEGRLVQSERGAKRALRVVGEADLRHISTAELRAELKRRSATTRRAA